MAQQPGQANPYGGFGLLNPPSTPTPPPPPPIGPTLGPIGLPSPWSLFVAAVIFAVAYRALFAREAPREFIINEPREPPPMKEYPPLRQEFLPYLQYLMIDPLQAYAAVAGVARESMNDLEGSRPRSRMTDEEISAAARAAFHLGAGWGGLSPTNEGGIATINSQGEISWSSTGQLNEGHAQFASGKDALDALGNLASTIGATLGIGRGPNTTTPNNAPTPTQDEGIDY
jgi:hypothetical protein